MPVELFASTSPDTPPDVQKVMDDSIAVARSGTATPARCYNSEGQDRRSGARRLGRGRLLGPAGRQGVRRLGRAVQLVRAVPDADGDWSIRRSPGWPRCTAASARSIRCAPSATRSRSSGSCPAWPAASGCRAFALTEPCAGCDLTALRTTAERDGDDYVVNGEKLFITNVVPGRTIGLVCLIDEQAGGADRRSAATKRTRTSSSASTACARSSTRTTRASSSATSACRPRTCCKPPKGDGLTIAYHGLNLGRVSLCANAAGTMRLMMASMIPWAKFRKTYGAAIVTRELVQRRLGELAGLIVACDALVAWCAGLIDRGYRGEMECIVAKIFGSEAQKEAADRVVHEDPRRPLVPARPHVRRQRPRVPRPLHLRGRRRNAGDGASSSRWSSSTA